MKQLPLVVVLAVALASLACGDKKSDEAKTKTPTRDDVSGKPKLDDKAVAKRMDKSLSRFNRRGYTFGFDSAKIVFKVKSPYETGTITAWIAGAGATIGVVRELVGPASPKPVKQTVLWRDGKNTQWDDRSKSVYITRLRSKATELRLISSDDPATFKMAGYEKQADETVAGKPCQVWEAKKQRVKLWRYKGIDLRYDNRALKSMQSTLQAESVSEGVPFPNELFTPPTDYKVNDRTR